MRYAVGMSFYTEKETEDFLKSETRMLPMPDGSIRQITKFSLFWHHFDYVVSKDTFNPVGIAEMALKDSETTGRNFETALDHIVHHAKEQVIADREKRIKELEAIMKTRQPGKGLKNIPPKTE